MRTQDAIGIVLDLAEQNVIDERDNADEHKRQTEAIEQVRAFLYFNKWDI